MAVIANCEPDPCSEHPSSYRGLAGGGYEDFFCEGDSVPHSDRCAESGGWYDYEEFVTTWWEHLEEGSEICEHLFAHWSKNG